MGVYNPSCHTPSPIFEVLKMPAVPKPRYTRYLLHKLKDVVRMDNEGSYQCSFQTVLRVDENICGTCFVCNPLPGWTSLLGPLHTTIGLRHDRIWAPVTPNFTLQHRKSLRISRSIEGYHVLCRLVIMFERFLGFSCAGV